MHDNAMIEWLGDVARQLTDDELARFAAVWARVDALPAAEDDPDWATDVLSAALQHILGELDLAAAGAAYRRARRHCEAAAAGAALAGMPEQQVAERSTLARMTVRKLVGK